MGFEGPFFRANGGLQSAFSGAPQARTLRTNKWDGQNVLCTHRFLIRKKIKQKKTKKKHRGK